MSTHKIHLLSLLVTAISFVSTSSDRSLDEEWTDFKLVFKKSYSSKTEENVRRFLWEKNVRYIQKHNLQADLGIHTFFVGMNKYGDLSGAEFARLLISHKTSSQIRAQVQGFSNVNTPIPDSIDWRSKGCVSPVMDQDSLYSWAFAADGSLEGQVCAKSSKLVELSVQNLVDCVTGFGSVEAAFEYVLKNGGIDTAAGYPYEAKKGPCRFNKQAIGAKIKGIGVVTSGSESSLRNATATIGPIAAYIDASQPSFQLYRSGVYNDPYCSSTKLDHVVIIVGYGSNENGTDYWIVKNSWGSSWGMNGYILMSRNKDNQCGIATMNCYAIV